MLFKIITSILYIAFLKISTLEAKLYDRCELAKELIQQHRIPENDIANWICLIRWESNFDTSAVGNLNWDGSLDHGLFQISDKYWCDRDKVDGACGLRCSQLEDENIRDDAVCARRIFRITKFKTGNGFDAWAAWKQHCENQDAKPYIANCTLE